MAVVHNLQVLPHYDHGDMWGFVGMTVFVGYKGRHLVLGGHKSQRALDHLPGGVVLMCSIKLKYAVSKFEGE
jgi:hypothetical protein